MSSRLHRRIFKRLEIVLVVLVLLLASAGAQAQGKKKKPAGKSQPTLADRVAEAKQDVIRAAKEYKASLEKLLVFQEADVKAAAEMVEKRKALLQQSIISRKEVEEGERLLAAAQTKVNETRKQMGETDNLMSEAAAEEKLAKLPPARLGTYQATSALIRYNGTARWALSEATKVEGFYLSHFHRSMPVSAFGQTAVHTQLGFDHSNSMDVAVHPDSAEGQALMSYLRSAGIPFIAFRHAVAGSATGAHIHVGYPSHRIR
ncbi:MAG TPA: hypothetical protein VJZ26_03255 [Blastocatellia bacterium]|nr:hypothetical protein [Blastocatellia bacterium]